MNIQIFGKAKCFETKKAERYFKERKIKFQSVDVVRFGMSRGELHSVIGALSFDAVFNSGADGAEFIRYLAETAAKEEKLLENQALLKTPIVRNGKQATVGYAPDIWKNWE